MNSVPPVVAVSTFVFVSVITAARWFLLDEVTMDRLVNRALGWNLIGLLLAGPAFALGEAALGHQLFLSGGLIAVAYLYGLARLLDGAPAAGAAHRQRRYNAVAASVSGVVLFGAVAQALGLSVTGGLRWDAAIWAGSYLPILVASVLIARACVRELRLPGDTVTERLAYSALLAVACFWVVSACVALVRAAIGVSPEQPGKALAVVAFVNFAVIAVLISFPLVDVVLVRAQLDRAGRACRSLRPLWRDLTAAVPEVVLREGHVRDGGSALRLYRMTVEIWDALLHLKQYRADAPFHGDAGERALAIAYAAQAKTRGGVPEPVRHTGTAVVVGARDRSDELRYLLDLAAEWPKARALASAGLESPARRTYFAAFTKAGSSLFSM
ncbi:DUF6545 domain-containing protein [Nocardia nepalensis]|uniref:DUF6545 domain-containing protein n=1 Tax=Nocardia nepalensis TaxID=3375448 RepID=UPI003B67E35B